MELIIKNIVSICTLIILMGIISDICAFPATEKIIRFIISLYIIAAVFKSLHGAEFEIKMEYPDDNVIYSENTEVLKNQLITKTADELEILIKNRLDEKNISYNSLSVHILEQNDCITVDKILIDCNKEDEKTVLECVQDIVSTETKIITGE